jgi:hypothetical protein
MKRTVRITMKGGVIQDIEVPKDVRVIVRDYDVDGQEEGVQRDENGDPYLENIWE